MEAARPLAAESTIAELAPGRHFEGIYACVRKDRLSARNGSIYLSMELRDRTGSIPARAFRDVDRLAARFERGNAIRVSGKVHGLLTGHGSRLAGTLGGRHVVLRMG